MSAGATAPADPAGVAARALGLVVLLPLGWIVATRGLGAPAGGVLAFVHGIDLVFHEAGHPIWGLLGTFPGVLGGSLTQVLVPAVCVVAFLRGGQRAAAAVALFWTGESLTDVAVYVADGRARALPLLADGLIHDWHWILERLGWLDRAEALGRLVYAAGVLTLLAALVVLALDLVRCWTTPPSPPVAPTD